MANRKKLSDKFIEEYPSTNKTLEINDSIIKNLAIRIYKSGNKSFVYRYYSRGYSKRYTIGKFGNYSTEQARIEAQQIYKKIQNGIDPLLERKRKVRENRSITFKKAVCQFLEEHAKNKSNATKNLYSRILKRQFKKLNSDFLTELCRKQVMDILRAKKNKGSPDMSELMRKTIHTFLNWCTQNGLMDENPIKGVPAMTQKNKRHRYYNFDEILEIWQYIETFKQPYQAFYKILFLTGQRKNETRLMKWENLNGRKALWIIPAEVSKNGTEHKVPLTPHSLKILQELKKSHSLESKFVFKSNRKDKPFKGVSYYSKKIKENTIVTDFRNHDIRRTVATQMSNLGVSPFVIGRILNHKQKAQDVGVTAIYNRGEYINERRKALEKWNHALIKFLKTERIKKIEAELDGDSKFKKVKFIVEGNLEEHNFENEEENAKPVYKNIDVDF